MATLPSNVEDRSVVIIQEIPDQTPFPNFSRPKIVGCFSLDENADYVNGPVHMKFLKLPPAGGSGSKIPVRIDLNEHCPERMREDEDQNHINTSQLKHLLTWIHHNRNIFEERRPHFVMYRGLMTSLLGTPYETRESWCIGAISKNGTIYLRQLDTTESLKSKEDFLNDPRLRRFGAWGHHFENFLTCGDPTSDPDPASPSKTECNIMYSARLNDHNLLYCAELDGVWQKDGNNVDPRRHPERLNECNLVELKTTRFFPRGQMTHNFKRFNLRKWWCQSFPACVSDVVVGYRNDDGLIRELEVFPLKMLPKLGVGWTGTVCFNFLDRFLTEVKRTVTKADKVYVFTFDPKKQREINYTVYVSTERDNSLLLTNLI